MDTKGFQEEVIGLAYFIHLQSTLGDSKFSLPNSSYKIDEDSMELTLSTDEIIERAQNEINDNKSIKDYLCPGLKTISEDIKDIGKIVTTVLLPLSLSGAVTIPMNPLIYAGIVIIIYRSGVSSLCAEKKKENESK